MSVVSSVDDLLAEVKRRKIWVSNLYQGTDDLWRCLLREKRNGLHVKHGRGNTAADALRAALKPDYEDLL